MKKIISSLITIIILVGMLAIGTSATGNLIFSDDFEMGFKPLNWIQGDSSKYTWDSYNKCVHGYQPARVLQSNFQARDAKKWDQFYGKFDIQVRAFDDLVETDKVHTVKIWYRDLFESENVGAVYYFGIEIETGRVYIEKSHDSFQYRDENNILREGQINTIIAEGTLPGAAEKVEAGEYPIQVGEDAPWYEMGIRITSGRIEGWFEQEMVIFAEADPDDEKLGQFAINSVDSTVGSQKSPFVFWNGVQDAAMWIALDNFEIWTPDYDFASVTYGDVNGDTKINLGDVSAMLKKIAKWDVTIDETAADVDVNGKVNLGDVSLVLKHIAKWDVELGTAS